MIEQAGHKLRAIQAYIEDYRKIVTMPDVRQLIGRDSAYKSR